jgi:hypothetical protein
VISTVDPEARHGHKTAARGYDGYKGHIAIDPDAEIITAAEVTAGNVADGSVAKKLIVDVVREPRDDAAPTATSTTDAPPAAPSTSHAAPAAEPVEVYGDASYGTAEILLHLEAAGAVANVKVQAPVAHNGHFSKDAFAIDLDKGTVTCPAGRLVQIRRREDGSGLASFGVDCKTCPKVKSCTDSKEGRNIHINKDEAVLRRGRERQKSAKWRRNYKATRPKVERKLAHLMRRRHGGRRARMRGRERVAQDFLMLCAAVNLQRLANLGLRSVDARVLAAAA